MAMNRKNLIQPPSWSSLNVPDYGQTVTSASNLGYNTISAASAVTFNQKEYSINGSMLTVTHIIPEQEWNSRMLHVDEIKRIMVEKMVNEMCKSNHIEFTKMVDPVSFEHRFHARIYVVPDTQVRIIRENKLA